MSQHNFEGSLVQKFQSELSSDLENNLCLFVYSRETTGQHSYVALLQELSNKETPFSWTHSEVLCLYTLWDFVLHQKEDSSRVQTTLDHSAVFAECNLETQYRIVHSVLSESRENKTLDICPDLLQIGDVTDSLYSIYAILLLIAENSESLDCLLRPLLVSPFAASHMYRIISICSSLLRPVVESVGRCVDRLKADITDLTKSTISAYQHPLIWLYSSTLVKIAKERYETAQDASYAVTIRDTLTASKLLPHVCIQLSTEYNLDLCGYLNEQIASPQKNSSKAIESYRVVTKYELSKLWLFLHMEVPLIRELLLSLLRTSSSDIGTLTQILRKAKCQEEPNSIVNSVRGSCRVMCALISILQHRHGNGESLNDDCSSAAQAILDPNTVSSILQLAEASIQTVYAALYHPSAANSDSEDSSHTSRLTASCVRCVVSVLLTTVASFRPTPGKAAKAPTYEAPSELIQAMLRILMIPLVASAREKMSSIRDAVAKEMNLLYAAEFLSQGTFLHLAQTLSAATISLQSVIPKGATVQEKSVESNNIRVGLIERDKRKLLMEFHRLPVPDEISATCEFSGDWVYSLQLLLHGHIITNNASVKTNEDVFGDGEVTKDSCSAASPREVMTDLLQRVNFPPHSLLLDVLDTWLNVCVSGYEDGDGAKLMLPPSRDSGSGSNITTQEHVVGRDSIPFLPRDIRQLTACLENLCFSAVEGAGVSVKKESFSARDESHMLVRQELRDIENSYGELYAHSEGREEVSPLMSDEDLWSIHRGRRAKVTGPLSTKRYCGNIAEGDDEVATVQKNPFCVDVYRAAVACYVSLQYQSMCGRNPRSNFTCVVHCDPRDLPVRRCIGVHILAVQWLQILQEKESVIHAGVLLNSLQCADSFLSAFSRLTRQNCPELLIQDRSAGVMMSDVCREALLAPVSKVDDNKEDVKVTGKDNIVASVLEMMQSPCQEILILSKITNYGANSQSSLFDTTARITKTVMDVMRSVLSQSVTRVPSSRASITSQESDTSRHHMTIKSAYILFKTLHAMHPVPSVVELDMFNCLLEMGEVRRPQVIPSYQVLIQEPLVLFRLPTSLLSVPVVLKITLFIFRSVIVASRISAHQALRCIQARFKSSLQSKARHPSGVPHGSLLESCNHIDDSEFSTLQEVVAVRSLFEFWHNINDSNVKITTVDRNDLAGLITSHIRRLLTENSKLLDVLLHYGIHHWSIFLLLSRSASVMKDIAISLKQDMVTALDQQQTRAAPPPPWTPRRVELTMVHFQFLVKAVMSSKSCQRIAIDTVDEAAEFFYRFMKKSSRMGCWKQPSPGSSLGNTCCESLLTISAEYPHIALRIISCLTKRDLVQSCPFGSVLVHIQPRLQRMHSSVCQGAVPLTIQKRMRSSSELNDTDVFSVDPPANLLLVSEKKRNDSSLASQDGARSKRLRTLDN